MGTVDVERYTGSCLISTAVRPKCKRNEHGDKNETDSNRRLPDESMALNGSNLLMPPTAGQAFPIPPNDPRNWAGLPLVSIAATIRKGSKNKNPRHNVKETIRPVNNMAINWRPTVLTPPVYVRTSVVPDTYPSVPPRNPHSLQGAPLIRVPRPAKNATVNGRKSKNGTNRCPVPVNTATVPSTPPPAPPPVPLNESSESLDGSSSCLSSDSSSVTSDEGLASGGSESSLPRLIKPRKRRKKERKLALTQRLTSIHSADGEDLLANDGDPLAHLFHLSLSSPTSLTHLSASSTPTDGLTSSGRWMTPSAGRNDDIWPAGWTYGQDWPSHHGACSSSWPNLTEWKQHPQLEQQRSSCWPDRFNVPVHSVAQEGNTDPNDQQRLVSDSGCLEVSSEIITSPYGHRDIEIRFFSSFRHSASNNEDKRSP